MHKLKNIRIWFSGFVILCFAVIFFDFLPESVLLEKTLLQTQIIPAIKLFSLSSVIVLSVLFLLTLLFGRLYCSFLCPLGIYQDVVTALRNRKKRVFYAYRKPMRILAYVLCVAFILSFVSGRNFFVVMLDPYAVFGRMATNIYRPLLSFFNNLVVGALEQFGLFKLPYLAIHYVSLRIFAVVAGFFLLINISAAVAGRWYCVNVCPVGTFLGCLSRFSRYKVRLDREKCTNCGMCEKVCKTSCIDSTAYTVHNSECVMCFNCIDSCKFGALSVSVKGTSEEKAMPTDEGRRRFLNNFFILTVLPGFSKMHRLVQRDSMVPVTPPGSVGVDNFSSKCISCNLCVAKCPNKVLVPSFMDYGVNGIMQPKMNYGVSFCSYECNKCSQVCPTGAIKPISLSLKKRTQLGISKINRHSCIPYTLKKDCGACAEHCPTQAVHMVERNGVFVPEVSPDLCIGCGVCEYVCPTRPKSIIVYANRMHRLATAPSTGATKASDESKIVYDLPF